MDRYADKQNLTTLAEAIRDKYSKVASSTTDGLMSKDDKSKLDGLSTAVATTSANGLMSSADKTKLDGIESGANNYELPLMSPTTRGGAKLGHGLTVEDGALGIGSVTDPTDAGPIVALSAKGWAEQDTTTGKNLLPRMTGMSYDGLTSTVNADGSVTVKGTATSDDIFITPSTNANFDLAAGTYTVSGGVNNNCRIRVGKEGASIVHVGATPQTFTLEEQTTILVRIRIQNMNGQAVNATFYPQLELGSTATSYEPYSGGAPSPSPSYPQEIKVCRGRNLLNPSLLNSTYYSTNADGSVTVVGSDGATWPSIQEIPLSAGSYVLSRQVGYGRMALRTSDDDYASDATVVAQGVNTIAFTLASDGGIKVKCGYSYSGVTVTYPFTEYIQLELGSVAHPYVPYGCVGVDVQSRNLLDYDAWKTSSIQRGTAVWENNGVTLTATSYDCYTIPSTRVAVTEGQTITLSWKADSDADGSVYVFLNGNAGVGTNKNNKNVKSLSYTIPAGGEYITFRFGATYVGTTIKYSDIQIEVGSTATAYEHYYHTTIPIPLPSRGWVAALPDGTCDTLALDGAGGYEWTLNTDERVMDGSETWGLSGTGKRVYIVNFLNAKVVPDNNTTVNTMCSHFAATTNNETYSGTLGMSYSINGKDIYFADGSGSMTVESWVAWLAQNPVTVLYPLATPTTESGYVSDMPVVPAHAAISSIDLVDLAVRCCADEGAAEIASAWGRRYEERIANLESIVSEIVAGA